MHQDLEMMKSKHAYILITLCTLSFLGGVHKYFYNTGIRWNMFLFYDYATSSGIKGKLASGILYEVSYMIEVFAVLVMWKYSSTSKSLRNVISPFIGIAFIDIMDYICFYKQLSYYKLPLLVVLILIHNRTWIIKSMKK